MSKPDITIILAAYNMQRYIGETLRSIYAQTSDNFNLIVIDDGSTDYTRQVIRACTYGKPRTTVIHGTHKTLGPIRNEAIEAAQTEWILPFDADDLMHPDLIAEFTKAIHEHHDARLFICWYHHFEAEDRIVQRRFLGYERLLKGNHIPSESCYRKSAWKEVGGYHPVPHYEDWEMWIRLLHDDRNVIEIPKVLIEYRIRPESLSHAMTYEERVREHNLIHDLNKDIYKEYGL